jgi:hypothetical protein
MGFLFYSFDSRMFIKDFAEIAAPLRKLTRIDMEFEWTKDCEEAFQALKRIVGEEIVLKGVDYGKDAGKIKLAADSKPWELFSCKRIRMDGIGQFCTNQSHFQRSNQSMLNLS